MYTIKHAADVTGLTPATMRAWERRYGVVTPHRTDAGYRLYDDQAILALSMMATLVSDGWSAREAAEETARRVEAGALPLSAETDPRPPQTWPGQPNRALASPGNPPGAPAWDVTALAEATANLDADAMSACLDENFSRATFETVVDEWLMPSLVALGQAWVDGRVSVAGEHMASNAVMRRLAAAYEAAATSMSGPKVLIGLPPGSRHELGVLAFAVAARRAGLTAAYLGADLPSEEWASTVTRLETRAVVLSALQGRDIAPLRLVVADLRATHPDILIAVGGSLQSHAPDGCLLLGNQIGQAAANLAARLG